MVVLEWLFEYWLPIRGYEGLYEVSNWGRVRSLNYNHTGKIKVLIATKDQNGYLVLSLYKNGQKRFYVHRLVAEAFLPNPQNYTIINHKDENTSNACVWNLEWCDYQYNNTYEAAARKCDKKIGAFKDNVLVKVFDRGIDVQEENYCRSLIYRVIDKNKKAYGFTWKHL